MRADVDIDRHRQDDADETPTRGPPAGFQHKQNEDGADDQAIQRQVCTFERQGLVTGGDVTAQNDRGGNRNPVAPMTLASGFGNECERQRQSEADGQNLFEIDPRRRRPGAECRVPTR